MGPGREHNAFAFQQFLIVQMLMKVLHYRSDAVGRGGEDYIKLLCEIPALLGELDDLLGCRCAHLSSPGDGD
jgi:hypothetical protein